MDEESGRIPEEAWKRLNRVNLNDALNKLMIDPSLLLRINDAILRVSDRTFVGFCIVNYFEKYGLQLTITEIIAIRNEFSDPKTLDDVIGSDTWQWIKEYRGL